ncbi:MoxR family ATPase [Telmatocola sphagniphila]|uniref:MoxR family ATPase n=1 Tax=Telmatocola sphagniphila TaxID=1123043 RepID=A0A8E6B807_9BACT|nr:MoxR family ATPase [Telmatocola sphagniphila]QVL32238.1 MoxR family ATPase [Telmatocola sphagniphila]
MSSAKLREEIQTQLDKLEANFSRLVVGQKPLFQKLMVVLLSDGHMLLEGLPGLAKTLAIRTLASLLNLPFHRVQFTPDLLPADILGTQIYQPQTGEFRIRKGPIFAGILLADEINRAPAKVQSALLEAMQERQVTIGETTFPLPEPFLVLATQNPIDQEGTYPLPEASLDRFLLKAVVGYPSRDEELQILDRQAPIANPPKLEPVMGLEELKQLRAAVDLIHLDPKLKNYIVDVVRATRHPEEYQLDIGGWIQFGASPRATIALARIAKAQALLAGRDYVNPDDIRSLSYDVLRHRIVMSYEGESQEKKPDDVVKAILGKLPIP